MSEGRIVTNGLRFRVQRKRSFFGFSWWSYICDMNMEPWETISRDEADSLVRRLDEEGKAATRGWKVESDV